MVGAHPSPTFSIMMGTLTVAPKLTKSNRLSVIVGDELFSTMKLSRSVESLIVPSLNRSKYIGTLSNVAESSATSRPPFATISRLVVSPKLLSVCTVTSASSVSVTPEFIRT